MSDDAAKGVRGPLLWGLLIVALALTGAGLGAGLGDGLGLLHASAAGPRFVTLAATTAVEESGLLGRLLPAFEAATGVEVHIVAVASGRAISFAERGEADALLVDDPEGEDRLLADGAGIDRRHVMRDDFVIVGPASDPAGIRGSLGAAAAFARIAAEASPFASRGDASGANRLELGLWRAASVEIDSTLPWYHELGSGMDLTLNTAVGLNAYTLTDRASWANIKHRGSLEILVEGDPRLANRYDSILVNPARFPRVQAATARIWLDWLSSPAGVAAIASYRIKGRQVFVPMAAGTTSRSSLTPGSAG